jgi:hypothetical protein
MLKIIVWPSWKNEMFSTSIHVPLNKLYIWKWRIIWRFCSTNIKAFILSKSTLACYSRFSILLAIFHNFCNDLSVKKIRKLMRKITWKVLPAFLLGRLKYRCMKARIYLFAFPLWHSYQPIIINSNMKIIHTLIR